MSYNITDFMFSVFTDEYETTEDSDRKLELKDIVEGIPMCLLKDYCWEAIEEHFGGGTHLAYDQAVHKSIDFVELKRELKEWLEAEEAAE